jgi:hypothetical protein
MAFSNFKNVGQVMEQYPLRYKRKRFLPDASIEAPQLFLENIHFALERQAEDEIFLRTSYKP